MIDYQTTREMITRLEAFRGHDLEEYHHLVEPLAEFVFSIKLYNLEAVNKLAEAILPASQETTTMEIEPTVSARLLADQIKPWIEGIRQTLFHSKTAPFSCFEDAKIWWEEAIERSDEWAKRAEEWQKRAEEKIKRVKEWDAHWDAMCEKYPHLNEDIETRTALRKQGIPVEVPTHNEYQQLDNLRYYVDSLEVGEKPEQDAQYEVYSALLDEIIKINVVTGFTMKSVRAYILADTLPVLPTFTFGIHTETHSLPDGTSLVNRSARVRIRGELTFEDLRSLYRGIRRELGIKRSKRPTTKHLQLYEMVQQKGDIPSGKGTVAFWESVMKEWNNLPKQDKYNTWKGVKMAYERIVAQFERRITTKEAYQ
jgi:uncharacterized protein YdcH (DUF465 family)